MGDIQRINLKNRIVSVGVQRKRKDISTAAYNLFKVRFTAAYLMDHLIHRCFMCDPRTGKNSDSLLFQRCFIDLK